jgi:hypothetical protein
MSGYKTYIVGAVMIGLAVAKGWGWIPAETCQEIQSILVGLGLWTLRAGIKNDCQFR